MRIYFAAMMGIYFPCAQEVGSPPLLVSFWDARQGKYNLPDLHANYPSKCFADSGAFSAANSGAVVDLGEFAEFALQHRDLFDKVSSLDVIGDPKGSARNLVELHKRNVPALPVWHLTSPLADLDAMCREFDSFSIGGMVPYSMKPRIRDAVLVRAWDVVYKHWPRKVHGFGLTHGPALRRFAWHSVDSSSCVMSAAYGTRFEYDPPSGKVKQVDARRVKPGQEYVMGRRTPMIQMRCKLNIGAMLELQHAVTKEWAAKGVVWND